MAMHSPWPQFPSLRPRDANRDGMPMDSPELRHRLLAILAADAVGYSRLMSIDDHATVVALEAARAQFHAHVGASGGRVIDTAGDSVLAVFDSAVGAVTAALAVQKELAANAASVPADRRMHFRIGVHLGDVIEKADGTVYGDGVNIAARLEGLAEPGGVTVSDSIRSAVKGKVSAEFDDQGEQQVKNIADPMRAFSIRAEGVANTPTAPVINTSPAVGEIDLSLPDKPSIAVLAFTNMSGDPEQEYFTDGITEDIITELSRFQSLFVIARNSSFTYKGKAVDIKQVGRELGVRYVVEGSIRRASSRVRVTAQLIDTLTGSHIWAERYDREVQDIFAVQEEVTECIVAAVAPQIDVAEAMRARRRPSNLSAYELAVRAVGMLAEGYRTSDRGLSAQGLDMARKALAIDPESTMALLAIGFAQFQNVALRIVVDRERAWQEGIDAVDRAIELADSGTGHAIKACLISHAPSGSRWDEARVEAETGYRLNPQDTMVIGIYAMTLSHTGDALKAIQVLERSLRINPRNPLAYDTYFELAQAYLMIKQYADGMVWAMRARAVAPRSVLPHLLLTVLQVGLGDLDQARAALNEARRLAPELVQKRLETKSVSRGPEFRQRYDTFLRVAAGLDEPGAADAIR